MVYADKQVLLIAINLRDPLLTELDFDGLKEKFHASTYFLCTEPECTAAMAEYACAILYFDSCVTPYADVVKTAARQWHSPPVIRIECSGGKVRGVCGDSTSKWVELHDMPTAARDCYHRREVYRRRLHRAFLCGVLAGFAVLCTVHAVQCAWAPQPEVTAHDR